MDDFYDELILCLRLWHVNQTTTVGCFACKHPMTVCDWLANRRVKPDGSMSVCIPQKLWISRKSVIYFVSLVVSSTDAIRRSLRWTPGEIARSYTSHLSPNNPFAHLLSYTRLFCSVCSTVSLRGVILFCLLSCRNQFPAKHKRKKMSIYNKEYVFCINRGHELSTFCLSILDHSPASHFYTPYISIFISFDNLIDKF